MNRLVRSALLPLVGLVSAAVLAAPAHAAPVHADANGLAAAKVQAEQVSPNAYPASKVLSVAGDDQDTYYYCGPASVRNALSARGVYSVQSSLAKEMGTEVNKETDSVANVTPVLNKHLGGSWYESKYITGSTASSAAIALLKRDILLDTNNGYAIVANIYTTAYDTAGKAHSYPDGHYIDVIGYYDNGDTARIYDVANNTYYNMTTSRLATWIAERGYSA